ncbi:MAG: hypothetical protein M0C28_44180 [Candidatus Moduliflexus flocculans]|nr:hypothetical protein [Candidatus Moduliflexus flocculans]
MKNIDKQFDQLMQAGIPEDMRAYLGMMGFKVIINMHGERSKSGSTRRCLRRRRRISRSGRKSAPAL